MDAGRGELAMAAEPREGEREAGRGQGACGPTGAEPDRGRNLDSGYAWVILLVMFLLQSSVSGSGRVYGIVYAKEVAIGYYDREQASWPIATASAVENLAGILTPALAARLSWRSIELASTALFIASNLLAYFSSSLAVDILALGLVQGLALSTYTVLSLAINNDYFERYRTTAYGISMSGSAFGVLYLSPLVTWVLERYGDNFRLVYLALACVFGCNIALVLFIKPRAQVSRGQSGGPLEAPPAAGSGGGATAAPPSCGPGELENGRAAANALTVGSREPVRRKSRIQSHLERKDSIAAISYEARSRRQSVWSRGLAATSSSPAAAEQAPQARLAPAKGQSVGMSSKGKKISLMSVRAPSANELAASLYPAQARGREHEQLGRESSQLAGSQLQPAAALTPTLPTNSACEPELELDVASLYWRLAQEHRRLALPADSKKESQLVGEDAKPRAAAAPAPPERDHEFSLRLVGRLLRLPYLHCAWIMLALYYLIARIFVIILVDFADDHGFGLAESTSLLNYWSLGELVGRVLLGSLIDLKFLTCKACISLACLLLAGLILCMVLVESYLVYAACSLLIAALISLEYMLINVMMVEYLGKHMVTNCYSLAACLASLVLFARPSLIGFFRDQLGSYDGLLLLLAGLALAFALGFYLLEPWLVRHYPKPGTPAASARSKSGLV